jgi:hypothetical protein
MVAEMMNASDASESEKKVVTLIAAKQKSGDTVAISGAWRLWFEHPSQLQTQFDNVPIPKDSGPPHCFEIHPVTSFDGQDVTSTFRFVQGFKGYDADTAFKKYESGTITIKGSGTSVRLDSKKMVYNYTHFRMHLLGKPAKLSDGGFVALADVTDEKSGGEEDDVIAARIRMIFVPKTPPWEKIDKAIKDGSIDEEFSLDALGIPRLNLNAIATFLDSAANANDERKLPYEIIVVGVK